jgi:hypothetical protein
MTQAPGRPLDDQLLTHSERLPADKHGLQRRSGQRWSTITPCLDVGVDDALGLVQLLTRFQKPYSRPRVASTTNVPRSCGSSVRPARLAMVDPWNGRRFGGAARQEHRRPSSAFENMIFMSPARSVCRRCHRISSYPLLSRYWATLGPHQGHERPDRSGQQRSPTVRHPPRPSG